MSNWTFEELSEEHDRKTLGLQYTIAQRERLALLWRMVSEIVAPNNAEAIAKIMKSLLHSPAERFQDIFALLFSGGRPDGFFVEFGACDGLVANNTLTLERDFGWRGILAEPATFWHERLKNNRSVKIDTRCVSGVTGETLQFFQSEMPGNSSADRNHPYLGDVRESYTVPTVSLLDLLKDNGAPAYIDFMSVDTEGHEKEVLSRFDFDQYKFGFICVEQHEQVAPADDVRPLLQDAGYEVIFPREEGRPVPMQITGVDLFFVPKGSPWLTR